jgi:hypothetical protein
VLTTGQSHAQSSNIRRRLKIASVQDHPTSHVVIGPIAD